MHQQQDPHLGMGRVWRHSCSKPTAGQQSLSCRSEPYAVSFFALMMPQVRLLQFASYVNFTCSQLQIKTTVRARLPQTEQTRA